MSFQLKSEAILLLIGDIVIFYVSLLLMLFVRYGTLSMDDVYQSHITPFCILFAVWIVVFFIAGLYEKHTVILRDKLPGVIFNAQIVNALIAIAFFYSIPFYGIAPKTNLFVYLVISLGLVLLWRLNGYKLLGIGKKEKALLIGSGYEMREIQEEVSRNDRYGFYFFSSIDLEDLGEIDFQEEILRRMSSEGISVIVADLKNNKVEAVLPCLYNLIFSKVRFIDMHSMYEDIFDRIPLSLVRYDWFLENISTTPTFVLNVVKRFMDILITLPLSLVFFVMYPVVYVGTKLSDGGPIFFFQERVGKNNESIYIVKFRSMTDKGGKKIVTRFGAFLRKSRLDEFPQLWNVIRGDLSLIGPRPEIPSLVKEYEDQIPYYDIRHLIKPGLSGWAQLYHDNHPHHASDVQETKVKLSYDLYYIKNRSVLLDFKIALKTLKKLASRAGK